MSTTHVRSRSGHGRKLRTRSTHEYNGFLGPIEGSSEVYDQIVVDGVVTQQNIAPGSIAAPQIRDGSLTLSKFTTDIRPVAIVTVLPTLPSASYPLNSFVAYTVDGKLYRNISDVWTKSLDGVDIAADSITAAQIAAGAISVSELAAGAVTADKIAALAVTASKIDIRDDFGASVLNGSGFGGSWLGFLGSGLIYNSSFSVGLTGANFSLSQVGTGSTIADYEDSKSLQLPYWVIEYFTSSVFRLLADATASNGFLLTAQGTLGTSCMFYQDVSLDLTTVYPTILWREGIVDPAAGSFFNRHIKVSYRDVNHAIIGTEYGEVTSAFNAGGPARTISTVQSRVVTGLGPVPSNAVYLRVKFQVVHFGPATTVYYLDSVSMQNNVSPFSTSYTPTQLTSSVNNWYPTVLSDGLTLRVTTDTNQPARYVTGLVSGIEGQSLIFYNWGLYDVHLSHESTFSSVGNRFSLPGGQDLILRPGDAVYMIYTSDLWRVASPSTGGNTFIQEHTATQLTANTNDWNPGSLFSGLLLRASTDSWRTVSGLISPPMDRSTLLITNAGSNDLQLLHQSTASSAANRFALSGNNDLLLKSGDTAFLAYFDARWHALFPSTAVGTNWVNSTFINSWVDYGTPFSPAGYYKDGAGGIHLRGLVKSGTVGLAIFVLPTGYRPQFDIILAVTSAAVFGSIYILADGSVVPQASCSNTWVSLENIHFRAV